MHEARFYYPPFSGRQGVVTICPHEGHIHDGAHGACTVRYNRGGRLCPLVYDKVSSRALEPVEKKSLLHFHPGSTAYSIGTVHDCSCTECDAPIDGVGMG
jgi:pyruvate formate lyase activating enzyme